MDILQSSSVGVYTAYTFSIPTLPNTLAHLAYPHSFECPHQFTRFVRSLNVCGSGYTAPPHLSTAIQPLRLSIRKGQTDLHLLTLVAQRTMVDPDDVGQKTVRANDGKVLEEPLPVTYPVVPGVSAEKVRQLIDAFLRRTKWRDMTGNYSQTIKPVREAWERRQSTTSS